MLGEPSAEWKNRERLPAGRPPRLRPDQVVSVGRRGTDGEPALSLAREFGVSLNYVYRLIRRFRDGRS